MVLADGDEIDVADLPERSARRLDPPVPILRRRALDQEDGPRDRGDLIRRALEKTKGNRTRAAELLEISHRALLYKIKDYGL